jgi:hypothetical protein
MNTAEKARCPQNELSKPGYRDCWMAPSNAILPEQMYSEAVEDGCKHALHRQLLRLGSHLLVPR